jgi:hypothetical protein
MVLVCCTIKDLISSISRCTASADTVFEGSFTVGAAVVEVEADTGETSTEG